MTLRSARYLWNYVNSVNLVKLVAFLKREQFSLTPESHPGSLQLAMKTGDLGVFPFCCADLCWFSAESPFPLPTLPAAVGFRSCHVPAGPHTLSGTAIVHSQFPCDLRKNMEEGL